MARPETESSDQDYDFRAQRLFVADDLGPDAEIRLDRERSHYVGDVIRLAVGGHIHLFNGRDGEWRAVREAGGRREAVLRCEVRLRAQTARPDLDYVFAPLKHARLDYMVQKAVEMGAGRLVPVMTRHTQPSRVNVERMRANAVEAAEQCGILSLPEVAEPVSLTRWLAALEPDRTLVFCDEAAPVDDPLAELRAAVRGPLAVLIGPEGGFDAAERTQLGRRPGTLILSLGPRILRADTAAVAALALVEAARQAGG
ncbi:16S rRNA (uracil(1498)-N(3))-methyltransferase [Ancylobacter pratisalsi]|uniref:Ribosomal RNA small subunit methyltransferase E n=1 Tax=Ancylobacter pratisalsi TaxID=1745854 RepID=A0A6P1YM79_9HYPH|nr:16S rRNA (uracil(1498)-N(3))-methyltransferase [Ancylobacter pratisalsi]QIB34192.1 16S rRNA (uracil(1498)-N(3))-methyltransferase [Ancylobacter pratisalsi]